MKLCLLRWSKTGLFATGLFLLLAGAVFVWVLYSSATNPADSGESGILLLPFAMPWIMVIPSSWLGPLTGFSAIFFNSFIIYCIFGGLRFNRSRKGHRG